MRLAFSHRLQANPAVANKVGRLRQVSGSAIHPQSTATLRRHGFKIEGLRDLHRLLFSINSKQTKSKPILSTTHNVTTSRSLNTLIASLNMLRGARRVMELMLHSRRSTQLSMATHRISVSTLSAPLPSYLIS
jgi:hypothetical protein